jgi:hypothetical protein
MRALCFPAQIGMAENEETRRNVHVTRMTALDNDLIAEFRQKP